jgi:hypothetical protein
MVLTSTTVRAGLSITVLGRHYSGFRCARAGNGQGRNRLAFEIMENHPWVTETNAGLSECRGNRRIAEGRRLVALKCMQEFNFVDILATCLHSCMHDIPMCLLICKK